MDFWIVFTSDREVPLVLWFISEWVMGYWDELFLVVDLSTDGLLYICAYLSLDHVVFLSDSLDAHHALLVVFVHAWAAGQKTCS